MVELVAGLNLELLQNYRMTKNEIVISSAPGFHPISQTIERPIGEVPSFSDFLASRFNSNLDEFWRYCLFENQKASLTIFTDQNLYFDLFIQFLKSVLADNSDENIFLAYKLFSKNSKLERLKTTSVRLGSLESPFDITSLEIFKQKVAHVKPSKPLSSINKSNLCFELLLSNYLIDQKKIYLEGFLTKVRNELWSVFLNELTDIRQAILNEIYSISAIDSSITREELEVKGVDRALESSKLLKWIVDPEFNSENIAYNIQEYPLDILAEIIAKVDCLQGVRISGASDMECLEILKNQVINKYKIIYDLTNFPTSSHLSSTQIQNILIRRNNSTNSIVTYNIISSFRKGGSSAINYLKI